FFRAQIKQLLIQIEETWKLLSEGPENEILRHHGEQSKTFTTRYASKLSLFYYNFIIYLTGFFYCTPPVIISGINMFLPTNETQPPKFLYRLEHVLDVDKYYNLLMLHAFISVFSIIAIATAIDGMFILCIEHICALFTCLKFISYNCNWYKISLRSRQLLRFTLMRAIKPCRIRAGNVFVISMETFSGVRTNVTLLR
ncbi:uncharacterized protein LOC118647187, partial [Monomorium pharaonis]|uniref:uncharacterized protein LOC118647187 n=1 Tax=Monomorium pharaonis TaxID=307658 RepID=UPI00174771AE